jgi:hypothetical protein
MIVNKINVQNTFINKAENDAPIGAHRNRPKSFQIAFQRMQPKTGPRQIINPSCLIQRCQYNADTFRHIAAQPARVIRLIKSPQPFVSNIFDYR